MSQDSGEFNKRPDSGQKPKPQVALTRGNPRWFLERDNEFTVLQWPPQSPGLDPIEHLWDVVGQEIHIMDVQLTNLQQLRDAVLSI